MNIIGINSFTPQRRVNSIVVKSDINATDQSLFRAHELGGSNLVCKGDPYAIKQLLILEEQEKLEYEALLQ